MSRGFSDRAIGTQTIPKTTSEKSNSDSQLEMLRFYNADNNLVGVVLNYYFFLIEVPIRFLLRDAPEMLWDDEFRC